MARDARTDEERSTQHRAAVLSMPYVDTSKILNKVLYREVLTPEEIKQKRIVPLFVDNHTINFGITNNTSQKAMKLLHDHFLDQRVTFSIVSDSGFNDYVTLYDPPKKVKYQDISIKQGDSKADIAELSAILAEVRPDDMLGFLVQQAFKLGSSDIHLESKSEGARIRFRVDGVLHRIAELTTERYRQLVSVLAVAADISTADEEAQTGQINRSFQLATGEEVVVNLRVEAVPAVNGMDAVLRLFNFKPEMLQLDRLGLNEKQDAMMRDIIAKPSGLVMVVGPTGSGKSTTLYSLINELNNDQRKIITLEDPVEYRIEGITQIPVKTRDGDSFNKKLRSVLRLDPDIIMIGEIRDSDTAKTALQAALTGHLVLSTYHASSASAALTRLLDAIGENPLYASTIRLIQSQRLVRRLDDNTKKQYEPSAGLEGHLEEIVQSIKADVDLSFLPDARLYEPVATKDSPFGYEGQFAIREMLTMTPDLVNLLTTKKAHELTTETIEAVAVDNGMLTMKQDGVLRALKGDTTYEEILRVLG